MFLLEQVVNGLVLGGYYLLIALGLSLIFSVGGIVNLAHGAFYAFGAYISVEVTKVLGFGPAVVISPVAVGMLGIAFERFILRRFYTADPILSLLVTFGLAMVAEQLIRMIWGAAPLSQTMLQSLKGAVFVGDFLFSRYRLMLLAVVAVVLVGVWLLLHKTSFGRVVRAGIQRPDMVAALGIRLRRRIGNTRRQTHGSHQPALVDCGDDLGDPGGTVGLGAVRRRHLGQHLAGQSSVARAGLHHEERIGRAQRSPPLVERPGRAHAEQRAEGGRGREVGPGTVPAREEPAGTVERGRHEAVEGDGSLSADEPDELVGHHRRTAALRTRRRRPDRRSGGRRRPRARAPR